MAHICCHPFCSNYHSSSILLKIKSLAGILRSVWTLGLLCQLNDITRCLLFNPIYRFGNDSLSKLVLSLWGGTTWKLRRWIPSCSFPAQSDSIYLRDASISTKLYARAHQPGPCCMQTPKELEILWIGVKIQNQTQWRLRQSMHQGSSE